MTYSLFRLTYQVNAKLGNLIEGQATGGTTTTLVDDFMLKLNYPDDLFNLGPIYIIRDAGAASAAPEGEFREVKDFVSSSGTVEVRSAFSLAPADGDFYALGDRRYPMRIIRQKINSYLQLESKIVTTDTSLTTATNQTEYTLPAALMDVRHVAIQGRTGASSDNQWRELNGWYVKKESKVDKSTLRANTLVFPYTLPSGYLLKIVYLTIGHDYLWVNTEKLDEWIPWELIVHNAWVECLLWKKQQTDAVPTDINEQLNFALDKLAKIEQRAPRRNPIKPIRLLNTQDVVGIKGRYGEYLG